jgi:hypothetical protein
MSTEPIAERWHVDLLDYHRDDTADSHSSLDWLIERPHEYYQSRVLKSVPQEKRESPSMALGTACHIMLFEPATWQHRINVLPKGTGPKSKLAEVARRNPRLVTITEEQHAQVHQIVEAVYRNPWFAEKLREAGPVPSNSNWGFEHAIRFKAPGHNAWLKCCFDFLGHDQAIYDLKIMADNSPGAFKRSLWQYGYYRQAPLYLLGRNQYILAQGGNINPAQKYAHYFVTVNSQGQPECLIHQIDPEYMRVGHRENIEAIEMLDDMRAGAGIEGNWHRPGFDEPIVHRTPFHLLGKAD